MEEEDGRGGEKEEIGWIRTGGWKWMRKEMEEEDGRGGGE